MQFNDDLFTVTWGLQISNQKQGRALEAMALLHPTPPAHPTLGPFPISTCVSFHLPAGWCPSLGTPHLFDGFASCNLCD